MAGAETEEAIVQPRRAPLWLRALKWLALAVVALVLLVVIVALGLDTSPGRRFVADRLAGYTTESGLNIRVGRIDGSVYGAMVLSDVRVSDPQGVFLTSPRLDVDWRPFAFLNNHVDVRSLTADRVNLLRRPALKPSLTPNAPLLPDLDIDIGKLKIDRLVIDKPVTGTAHIVRVASAVHIANRTAQLSADAAALVGPGIAGGDTLHLKLDGAPDKNRLDFDLKLNAPANGLVAGLAGIHAPLAITAGGNGDWHSWKGRAVSQIGGDNLADLMLTANDGHFTVRGTTHPALYFRPAAAKGKVITPVQEGPLDRLTAPALQVAIDATLDQRKANTRVQLTSDALNVSGAGLLDLANNTFGNVRIDAKLLTPGAIAPNLKGRNVAGTLMLNGPFATPTVQYALRAAAIGFGDTSVEQVTAQGLARVEAKRILIPVQAKAARVVGISAAGGLLDNVSIDGDVAITGSTILADNLRIRSNRINGTAIVVANLATGKYTGALKGQVNNYRIESIGILNLTTDAHLVTAKGGGFGIAGHVVARTQQIFNSGARSFLGGNAVVAADVGYDPKGAGVVTFTNVRMNAPQFRILHGSGRYDLKGGLQVAADAYSTSYGPLSARVTGSIAAPVVLLRAARPGLGVGLSDVVAEVRGRNGAYAITAKGGSAYGPFTADVVATPGKQLAIDVRKATFAGIDFHGQLQQTPAGPFAGRLQFAGSGVTGAALLAAQGNVQRADIAAHAYAAKIPGNVDFTIGRAIVNGVVVLYPKAPQVTADVQIADLRYGAMVISAARAKVNYQNGSGTAQAVATGSSGVPFHLALNAKLAPHLWLAALQGQASGINFKTGTPARIETDHGYKLLPTRIDFDQGSARIAGTYGDGLTLQMALDKLDLAVANALVPDLGIGGNATGQLNFAQHGDSVPQIDAHLAIANFSRADVAAVSEPVDVETIAKLNGDGGDLRALIKRGPATVGRIVADLKPIPGGSEGWVSRLMAAPLSGGIRYNGPAAVLFSFAALPRQQLTGPIAVAADFSGHLGTPQLNGLIRADNLTYENDNYGTRLTNMSIAGRFTADRLEVTKMQARAGDGTVSAQGSIGLAADSGFPIQLNATLNNAQLAKGDALGATATGSLQITNDKNGTLVKGDLTIPQARYQIVRQGQAEVPVLTGVRRKGEAPPTPQQVNAKAGRIRLAIRLHADNQLFVSGMGLESEWRADLRVSGSATDPRVNGRADIVRGTYTFAGKRLDIDHGNVQFEGAALSDPQINISASTTVNGVDATINITGTGQHPQIAFTSTPALPQDEVLSRLLFGSSVTNLSATEAIQLAAALNSLRGSGGGLDPLGKLRSATGIDRLRILGANSATGQGTSLAAGKYITNNIYVEIITDARGFTATQLQIALTKTLSLLSSTGTFGGSSASIKYQRDF